MVCVHVQNGTTEWVTSYSVKLRLKTFTKQRLACFAVSGQAEKQFLSLVNTAILLTMDDNTRLSILNP